MPRKNAESPVPESIDVMPNETRRLRVYETNGRVKISPRVRFELIFYLYVGAAVCRVDLYEKNVLLFRRGVKFFFQKQPT